MFAWISKRFSTPWNRKTRWTPLLQCQREFQRTLSKERSRVDRDDGCFGFIILRLTDLRGAKPQTIRLAKLLHRRLRDTDEKGHLGYGRIGILLPSTGSTQSEFVLEEVLSLARTNGLAIEGEVFVYPEQNDEQNGPDDFGRGDQSVVLRRNAITALTVANNSMVDNVTRAQIVSQLVVDPLLPARKTYRHSKLSPTIPTALLLEMMPAYPRWKRSLDILGASVGLVVASVPLLIAAIAIKLTSHGPVFFCQQRTGYLGKPFTIFKLRTMVANAEDLKAQLRERNERDGPAFKISNDPRITLVGRFLRATGLDELPQLFNVLRGDMSLVGPRPLPVDEAAQCVEWQKRREEVKPGITCYWQLMKRRKIAFIDWMRLDLRYSKFTSPGLDLKLIAKTAASVFLGRVGH